MTMQKSRDRLSKYAQLSDADVRGQFSVALTFFFAICFNIPGAGKSICSAWRVGLRHTACTGDLQELSGGWAHNQPWAHTRSERSPGPLLWRPVRFTLSPAGSPAHSDAAVGARQKLLRARDEIWLPPGLGWIAVTGWQRVSTKVKCPEWQVHVSGRHRFWNPAWLLFFPWQSLGNSLPMTVCGVSSSIPPPPWAQNLLLGPGAGWSLEGHGSSPRHFCLIWGVSQQPLETSHPSPSPSPLAQVLGCSLLGAPNTLPKFFCSGRSHLCFRSCSGTRWLWLQLIRSRRCLLQGCADTASELDHHSCLQHSFIANTGRAIALTVNPADPFCLCWGTVTRGASSSSWGVARWRTAEPGSSNVPQGVTLSAPVLGEVCGHWKSR